MVVFSTDVCQRLFSGNVKTVASETISIFPNILNTRMVIFPIMCKTQFTLIVAVNPRGVVDQYYQSRGASFIMCLNPGTPSIRPDLGLVSRRLRYFFNRIVESDSSVMRPTEKFNHINFKKAYEPVGEFLKSVILFLVLS